jgi:hypothetical protein
MGKDNTRDTRRRFPDGGATMRWIMHKIRRTQPYLSRLSTQLS